MAKRKSLEIANAIAHKLAEKQEADSAETLKPARRSYVTERQSVLSDLAEGRLKNNKLRLVDPATCRMWAGHNRIYNFLSKENCAELIDSIRAKGGQEMAAIVRPVRGEGGVHYEVIAGARRHFAVNYLREKELRADIEYLIDIRELGDEEAFRISDLENRGREDISDFERSLDYAHALIEYYENNQSLMAERIGVDRTWLGRFLKISQLPKEVIFAYGDVRDIGIRHAVEIAPLLENGVTRDRLLKEADVIKKEQEIARSLSGKPVIVAAAVLKRLKLAAQAVTPTPRKMVRNLRDGAGKTICKYELGTKNLVVTIPKNRLSDLAKVMKALEEDIG